MATSKYDILGVPRNACNEEIRAAYLYLARTSHPDLNQGTRDAESKFKAIQLAYETLRDPASRRRYDLGIVEKAVVYTDGHHRDPREASPWPSQDAHDADFDITANQLNFASRSNSKAAVAMCFVMLVSLGFSMLWVGRSTNQSVAVGQHDARNAAHARARTHDTRALTERADKSEALANPKVHSGNDGNAREFDGLITDVDHPGAVSLNLTSNEGESHSTEGKTSTFGLGMPVVDPSFLELPGATTDVTPSHATLARVEQPLAKSGHARSSPTVLSPPHEMQVFVLEDWHSMPFGSPGLSDDWQSMRLDPPVFLTGSIDFVFAVDSMQIPPAASSVLEGPNFVDFGSTMIGARSPLALIHETAELKGWKVPDRHFLPLDPSAFSNTNTLTQGLPIGRRSTPGNTSAQRNWHQMRKRLGGPVDPLVPSLSDAQLPSTGGAAPLQQTVGAQLSSPPTRFQNSPPNAWYTVSGLQAPTPSYGAAERAKPRRRNTFSKSSGYSTYPSASSTVPTPTLPLALQSPLGGLGSRPASVFANRDLTAH